MSYTEDRVWSDTFLDQVKEIIGRHVVHISSFEEDTKLGFDLIIKGEKKIAVRLRRFGFYNKYPNDITIRKSRPSGAPTELQKIMDGDVDWMLYGHLSASNIFIEHYYLINLDHFRTHLVKNKSLIKCEKKVNCDGTVFCAFDITSFPDDPNIIIEQK